LVWIVVGGAVLLVAIALAIGVRSLGNGDHPRVADQVLSPIVGGVALHSDDRANTISPLRVQPLPADGTVPGSSPALEWDAGQAAIAKAATLRLYADADPNSPLLDAYVAGTRFEVLEPSGEYDSYPVRHGGAAWVRVRAEDGLVGWAEIDGLTLMP
jgi:hypothetical protein